MSDHGEHGKQARRRRSFTPEFKAEILDLCQRGDRSVLADFLVAEGVVDDISHEGLRVLLRQEGVTFQHLNTWKASKEPRYAAKKARVEYLYAIADREVAPQAGRRRQP